MLKPRVKILLIATHPYSAMLDAFVVITKLMKWPENNFQLTMGCWKISLRPNQAFVKRGYKTNKKLSENCNNLLLERQKESNCPRLFGFLKTALNCCLLQS